MQNIPYATVLQLSTTKLSFMYFLKYIFLCEILMLLVLFEILSAAQRENVSLVWFL